jgi:uncharacterized coiled-coil protein SlyX
MDEQLYFNIRSKECIQVTNNADLIVNMPFSIDIADDEWLQVEVISAEIPLSFYNISTALQNNIFSYTKIPSGTVNLTIPSGNYTVDSLMTTLNGLQTDFTISYSDVFNKFLITIKSPVSAVNFVYSSSDYTQQLFGITASRQITSSSYFDGVCNLASVHSVLIRSSLNSGNSASTSQSNNDIICKVPLSVNYGGILIYNNNDFTRKNIIKSGSIRQFYIKLTEQNQKILDLNSCVWEMTILFTKIKHDMNTVSEEQRQRRTNNYIEPPPPPPPPPITQTPIMQPTSTFTPIQNEEEGQQNEQPLINKNEDNLSNDENSLIKKPEDLSVKPVDPYQNLDTLLFSLIDD